MRVALLTSSIAVTVSVALMATPSTVARPTVAPDLVAASATIPRRGADAGSLLRIRSVIRNVGRSQAPRTTLHAYLSRDGVVDRSDARLLVHRMAPLGARRARRVLRGARIPTTMPPGRVLVLVCVDQGRAVRELNERNNCVASLALIVRGAATVPVEPQPPVSPMPHVAAPTMPGGVLSDVAVRTRDGASHITYDVRWPRHTEPRPLVVLIHGGGWWIGDKRDAYLVDAMERVNDAGFVAASINYRLACGTPDAPRWVEGISFTLRSRMCGARLPMMVDDVVDSIRQLQETADAIGADRNRIALVGASAGGHLAFLAAEELDSPGVRVVANWSGPPTTAFIAAQTSEPRLRPSFTNAIGCDHATCPDLWESASPLESIEHRRPSYAVFSLGGEQEAQVPHAELAAFHRRLDELGIPNVLKAGAGTCHGSQCLDAAVVGARTTGLQATIDFLHEQLSFRR